MSNHGLGVDNILNVEYIVNMSKTFGEILREKRQTAGLSQRQLADRAGVDFSYISKIENGRLPAPADDTVTRLAEILHCPADDLFSAAKKLPEDVTESIGGEPAALRFLREATQMGLSGKEWEKMLGELQGLRGEPKRKGK